MPRLRFSMPRAGVLGLLDRHRADERPAGPFAASRDVVDDRFELLALGPVDEVRLLDAQQRPVGRDDDDVEVVDLGEFLGASVSAVPVMPDELLVLAEVVLEGDGRERLVLALDLDLLLGLDRLVQAVAPAAAGHQAAGELVDDDDLAVLDHVVDVALEQGVRAQRLVDVVRAAACWPGRTGRPACSRARASARPWPCRSR